MMNINKGNQNGFTLIEVLIGITVFAIGILALTIMQVGAVKGNSSASGLTEASTVGQDKLEELLALDYDDPVIDDTDVTDDGTVGLIWLNDATAVTVATAAGSIDTFLGTTNIQYNIFWYVAVNNPFTNTKTIRVIVNWNEQGRQRTVTLDTLKNEDA